MNTQSVFRNKNNVQLFIKKLIAFGFTRQEIAVACEVSKLVICAWEVGEMKPNNKNAEKLEGLCVGLLGAVK